MALHAIVHDFQLLTIALPATTESNILTKLIAYQSALTALNVQAQQNVQAQITVVQGQIAQEIQVFVNNQTAIANVIQQRAAATAAAMQVHASAGAYAGFRDQLGLNTSQLTQYLYLRSLKQLPATASLAVGFQDVGAIFQQ